MNIIAFVNFLRGIASLFNIFPMRRVRHKPSAYKRIMMDTELIMDIGGKQDKTERKGKHELTMP
jgi:hypothetical protein